LQKLRVTEWLMKMLSLCSNDSKSYLTNIETDEKDLASDSI
jgi:hypothetical protein